MAFAHLSMALVCIVCVLCLWSRPTTPKWAASAGAALTMLIVHVWMLASSMTPTHGHHGSHVGGHSGVPANWALLLMVLEVGTAGWVLTTARLEQKDLD